MKIAIIGANGQLGSDICAAFEKAGDEVIPLVHADIEIGDIDSVVRTLRSITADLIINTAAYTNVPLCETQQEQAYKINVLGAKNVACMACELKITLFHISTDYVFDGDASIPYVESDTAIPINVYGKTKLEGENFVREAAEQHCIFRVSGIYGKHPCRGKSGDNFVEMMIRFAQEKDEVRVVDDEISTPTSTVEIARQIVTIKNTDDYGVYHMSAEGSCSWYDFANEIFCLKNIKTTLSKADPGEFSSVVKRPKYSVLENQKLKDKGGNIFKHWKEGLKEYLET